MTWFTNQNNQQQQQEQDITKDELEDSLWLFPLPYMIAITSNEYKTMWDMLSSCLDTQCLTFSTTLCFCEDKTFEYYKHPGTHVSGQASVYYRRICKECRTTDELWSYPEEDVLVITKEL